MAKGKIIRWNTTGGYGWVKLDNGQEWFVHYSAITPEPRRGSDLTGIGLVEVVTGQGKKGPAVTSAKISEQELLRQSLALHTFQGVEIRGIRFEGGKAIIIQSRGDERRWDGEMLTVYDRRNHPADTATVTIRGSSKQEFGRTVETVTAVVLESSPDQEAEPGFVLDVFGYTSNTKNRMHSADLSKTEWHWSSVSGHANIHDYTVLVVAPFGGEIPDKYDVGEPFGSYPRETFQGFEAHCVSLLSLGEGTNQHNWVRGDGQNAWVAWDWNGGNMRRVAISANQSGKSGQIVFVKDDDTFGRRKTFEYEFKRLSYFVYLMRERVGKDVMGGKEEALPKSALDPESELLTSKEAELNAAGYTVYHEVSGGQNTMVYCGLQQGELILRGWDLRPVVYGFVPDMDPEQAKVFAKAIEILAGGKKLVASLKAGEIKQPAPEEGQVQQVPTDAQILYGTMPVWSFSIEGDRWTLRQGIATVAAADGSRRVALGNTRAYTRTHAAIVATAGLPEVITSAAVAKSGQNFLLVASGKTEQGKFLVRVNADRQFKLGNFGGQAHRGNPVKIVEGYESSGNANVTTYHDQLWVMGEGDVVQVGSLVSKKFHGRALFVEGGVLKFDSFTKWSLQDARANPAEYIKDGWCPVDCLPKEWIGRVVEFFDKARETIGDGNPYGLTKVGPMPEYNAEWNALKPSGMNPHRDVRPEVWAKLREDLVWDQKPQAKILDERDEVEFSDPPYHDGTQVVAKITEGEDGRSVIIPNTPGEKFHITKYEKGGTAGESREPLGQVRADYEMPRYEAGKIEVPDELLPLDGDYVVEFVEPRKYPWYAKVVRKAVATSEPIMDVEIYMGKSSSRDPSTVWVITADGKVLTEKVGEGRATFTAIPKSAVILRWQWSNYGYTYTEEWEVFYRPENLTEEQLATVEELKLGGEVKYFGVTGGWDETMRVGIIRYSTPYEKGFSPDRKELLSAMTANFPVDVNEYVQRNVTPQPDPFNPDHPVLKWIEVGPEKK